MCKCVNNSDVLLSGTFRPSHSILLVSLTLSLSLSLAGRMITYARELFDSLFQSKPNLNLRNRFFCIVSNLWVFSLVRVNIMGIYFNM